MSKLPKRIFAAFILILLIGVPFWDWRLGAVLWMCAWLVFIFQNLNSGRTWKPGEDNGEPDDRRK